LIAKERVKRRHQTTFGGYDPLISNIHTGLNLEG
jgi:hypothetical protein